MSCGDSDSSGPEDHAPSGEQDVRIDAYVNAYAEYPRLKEVLFTQGNDKVF